MTTCTSCGSDVTGKKFCQNCGTPVQATSVPAATSSQAAPAFCSSCGKQGAPGERFCSNCGNQFGITAQPQATSASYTPTGQSSPQYPPQQTYPSQYSQPDYSQQQPYSQPQYPQQPQQPQQPAYGQTNYPPQQPYAQTPYPQQPYGQPQYPQQPYGQPQYPQYPQGQMGYQPQPMMGQQPMILHCPVCMAMSPLGTPNCPSCHTSLAGVVPTPANMPQQNQQGMLGGLGGMMQGNAGKYAMGALGGAAAVLGGEMLLGGIEHHVENRVEGDVGYGYEEHHRRHEEGMLGGLGEISKDLGLF